MEAESERLDELEKIFKDGAQKASEENALAIWENTIRLMIETDRNDLFDFWNQLNSLEKQLLTAGKWFSYSEFKSLISNEMTD